MRNSHSARLLVTRWAVGPLALALAGALALCPSAASAAGTRAKPPNLAYAVTFSSNSALYRLFPRSHRAALAGRTGVTLTDITFRGQILYAISFTTLYRLNAANGARHQVGSLGLSSANALATQPRTNILYGADQHGDFFKINARTGHATVIGTFGHHLSSSSRTRPSRFSPRSTCAQGPRGPSAERATRGSGASSPGRSLFTARPTAVTSCPSPPGPDGPG